MIGGYTQPAGEWKRMGALLVGVYENGQLKFAGRVGTGIQRKTPESPVALTKQDHSKILPLFQPARVQSRAGSRFNRRRNEALHLG